jgi:two-component system cell cycle sensor histidine kinase/response regulator CckA
LGMDAGGAEAQKLLAAEKAALQATSLTQQLLTFSKGGVPQLQATSIDQLVEDCAQFILRGSNVKCAVHKEPNLWAVDADPGQISQVVNNLLINADQAMSSGGTIRLSLTCETVRGGSVASLPSGDYVCIAVQDQGCGITPENQKRIFDPYFTTKQGGNGLGLASSYSIIQSHRGLMTVDSVPGVGTTFKVYLPKAIEAVVVSPEVIEDRIYPGEGRILVMDDMEAMTLVAGEILGLLGYDVAFAAHGAEAIAAYQQAQAADRAFDAVIFDLTVPGGMGGEEACQILLEHDPDLIAVASSGYTTSNVMSEYERAGFKAVVPKPYRIKELSAVLHRVLS